MTRPIPGGTISDMEALCQLHPDLRTELPISRNATVVPSQDGKPLIVYPQQTATHVFQNKRVELRCLVDADDNCENMKGQTSGACKRAASKSRLETFPLTMDCSVAVQAKQTHSVPAQHFFLIVFR